MRILKNRWFQRFARKESTSNQALCDAVNRANQGLIDADLGGGLIKQRVARPGAGRSGGYRTLILFRAQARAVFGFAKSDLDNISPEDEDDLKAAVRIVLNLTDADLDRLIASGQFTEVICD